MAALESRLPGGDAEPKAISLAVLDAVVEAASGNPDCGILVNSSTGKDSTLMTSLLVEVMESRVKAGLPLVSVMIGISDTRSEFPEVATRMRDERDAINAYAGRMAMPIEAVLVGPAAEKSLLVEIVGNGMALPQLKSSSASMLGASWCMDRVKKTPLNQVLDIAKERFPIVVQMIGTRQGESARRSVTVRKYSEGMPFGLTRLADNVGTVVGCVPVVHWTDLDVKTWMTTDIVPYDFFSADNLRAIYSKGSKTEDLAGECSVTVTKEGAVTSVCSDLTGTRFGCWMCLLSTNKSLNNTSRRDDRYVWLRKFHRYLFLHHKRGDVRRKMRNKLGFTPATLFPKSFLLNERAFMLMLLFRAEQESGFVLLDAEQLQAIQAAWNRQGYVSLQVEDVRTAASSWRKTGKPILPWANDTEDDFSIELAESICGGVIGQQMTENGSRANLLNMVAAFGAANPLAPKLMAWVFADPSDPNRQTVMVADSVNVLGGKTNGLIMGNWEAVGTRQPLRWELEMADGRSYFYCLNQEDYRRRVDAGGTPATDRVLQSYYENARVRTHGTTAYDCPLASGLLQLHQAGQVEMSEPEFERAYDLVTEIAFTSDALEEQESHAKHLFRQAAVAGGLNRYGHIENHGTKTDPEVLKAGAKLRKVLKPLLQDLGAGFLALRPRLAELYMLTRHGKANAAFAARLAYIARTSIYDESYAVEMIDTLKKAVCRSYTCTLQKTDTY